MNNLVEIDLCILLGIISCIHRNKMSGLGESINDYPNRIMLLSRMSSHFQDGMGKGWREPATFK